MRGDTADLRAVRHFLGCDVRRHVHCAWRCQGRTQPFGLPTAEVRREDGEVVTVGGCDRPRGHSGRDGVVHMKPHPLGLQCLQEALFPLVGEGADIGSDVDVTCTGLRGQTAGLLHDVTAAQNETSASLPQLGIQVVQAVGEESAPVGHVVACGMYPVVPDEERHRLTAGGESGMQHRIVVHSQITSEQGDRGGHMSSVVVGTSVPNFSETARERDAPRSGASCGLAVSGGDWIYTRCSSSMRGAADWRGRTCRRSRRGW